MKKNKAKILFLSKSVCLLLVAGIMLAASNANAKKYYQEKRRSQAITNSLDAWESIERRHFKETNDMDFDNVEKKHNRAAKQLGRKKESRWMDYAYRRGPSFGSPKHEIDARWSWGRYRYDPDGCPTCEEITEGNYHKWRGQIFGVSGEYTYRPTEEDYLYSKYINTYRIDGSYKWASDLEESSEGTTEVQSISVENYILEFKGLVGREYTKGNVDVLIYSGFGYRYRNDMGDKPYVTPNNYLTHNTESAYYYLPLGFELLNKRKNGWAYTLKGEYDRLLTGETSHYRSVYNQYLPGEYTDYIFEQKNGYAFKGSVEIAKTSEHMNLVLEPYVEYWNINLSEFTGVYDSENRRATLTPYEVEGGVKLGLKF